MIKYHTDRTLIRELEPGDSSSFTELMTNENINRHLDISSIPITAQNTAKILSHVIGSYAAENPVFLYAVVRKEINRVIGLISYKAVNEEEVEIFGSLIPDCWGKHISNEMVGGLISYLFSSTSFSRIIVYIKSENRSAIALSLKLGFRSKGLIYHAAFEENVHLLVLSKEGR